MLRQTFLLIATLCCATSSLAQTAPAVVDPEPTLKKPAIEIGFDGRGRGVKNPSPFAAIKEARMEAAKRKAITNPPPAVAQPDAATVAAATPKLRSDKSLGSDAAIARAKQDAIDKAAAATRAAAQQASAPAPAPVAAPAVAVPVNSGLPLLPTTGPNG